MKNKRGGLFQFIRKNPPKSNCISDKDLTDLIKYAHSGDTKPRKVYVGNKRTKRKLLKMGFSEDQLIMMK